MTAKGGCQSPESPDCPVNSTSDSTDWGWRQPSKLYSSQPSCIYLKSLSCALEWSTMAEQVQTALETAKAARTTACAPPNGFAMI
mmetsp:Transcript_73938/g.130431  ORF Transcript_73938/g.130431 Transcript_73938/m.130431 type:complete len:85 (-) Transcript_73938:415-669(-)